MAMSTSTSDTAPARAAFFRLEGTLHAGSAWNAALYFASNAASMRQRLLASSGALLGGLFRNAKVTGAESTRLAFAPLAGFTRDRLEVLADDYAKDVLLAALRPEARALLEGARADGFKTVLVTESLDIIAKSFSRVLGDDASFDFVLANELEFDSKDRCTGELVSPVLAPELDPKGLREFAQTHGIDLPSSRAYGSAREDLVLLGAVGHPCAVEPTRELARVARDLEWPIVRVRSERAEQGAST